MKNPSRLIALLLLASALWTSPSLEAAPDSYAAIAFSPATGRWGYGNGYASRAQATNRALQECGNRDAKTMWTKNAWVALAVSDTNRGGYGWAWAATASQARAAARRECLKYNEDARGVVCVSSYR